MQLLIEISDKYYEMLKNTDDKNIGNLIFEAVKYGIPVDLEGLKQDMKALNCGYPYGLDYLCECLKNRLGIEQEDINGR